MGDAAAAEEFHQALEALRQAAGGLSPAAVRSRMPKSDHHPAAIATIYEWLNGRTVPSDDYAVFLWLMIDYLQGKAVASYPKRPRSEWERLRRAAQSKKAQSPRGRKPRTDSATSQAPGPGRGDLGFLASRPQPVSRTSAIALQVHQAVLPRGSSADHPYLTPYLIRPHDGELRDHLRPALAGGPSALVMLIGESSTGKTRALYEALAALAPDRLLLRPLTAESLLEILRSGQITEGRILWLNEAQRFLGGPTGEAVASVLRELLVNVPGIVAVGTIWRSPYWELLTRSGTSDDLHSHTRELLLSAVTVPLTVPSTLTPPEASEWASLAARSNDARMGNAYWAGAADGRIVQHLSGGPELLAAYLAGAGQYFSHAEHALITAAIDARRFSDRVTLTVQLLADAAWGALDARERPADADWAKKALTALTTGSHPDGRRTDIRHTLTALTALRNVPDVDAVFEPADFLVQHLSDHHSGELIHPALWQALEDHDYVSLVAQGAQARGMFRHAVRLWKRAASSEGPTDLSAVIDILRPAVDPDRRGACWAVEHTPVDYDYVVSRTLEALTAVGARDAAVALADRAAEHVEFPRHRLGRWGGKSKQGELAAAFRDVGAERASRILLARPPAAHVDPNNLPEAAVSFLDYLQPASEPAVSGDPAERMAARAKTTAPEDLAATLRELEEPHLSEVAAGLVLRAAALCAANDPGTTAAVLLVLHESNTPQAVEALLARDPAEHVLLTQPGARLSSLDLDEAMDRRIAMGLMGGGPVVPFDDEGFGLPLTDGDREFYEFLNRPDPLCIAVLLRVLRTVGAPEGAGRFADRVADHAELPSLWDIAELLLALRGEGAQAATERLAERAIAQADFTDVSGLSHLLHVVREALGATAAIRLANAAVADFDRAQGEMASVIHELRSMGAEEALRVVLESNPGARAVITRPDYAILPLVGALRDAGEEVAAMSLLNRAANSGVHPECVPRPYGRNLDGSPAAPWTWDSLER